MVHIITCGDETTFDKVFKQLAKELPNESFTIGKENLAIYCSSIKDGNTSEYYMWSQDYRKTLMIKGYAKGLVDGIELIQGKPL